MRFLHTADWHIGKPLRGRSRMDEYAKALAKLVSGRLGLGESGAGGAMRWRDTPVAGPFRLRLPYFYAESGGAELRIALRSGGPLSLELVALVPPGEPENVLRLP